jgi:hypothetical protein
VTGRWTRTATAPAHWSCDSSRRQEISAGQGGGRLPAGPRGQSLAFKPVHGTPDRPPLRAGSGQPDLVPTEDATELYPVRLARWVLGRVLAGAVHVVHVRRLDAPGLEVAFDSAAHGVIHQECFFTPRHLAVKQDLADIVAGLDEGITAAEVTGSRCLLSATWSAPAPAPASRRSPPPTAGSPQLETDRSCRSRSMCSIRTGSTTRAVFQPARCQIEPTNLQPAWGVVPGCCRSPTVTQPRQA